MNTPTPEYCYDVPKLKTREKEAHLASCDKISDGLCSVYSSVCRKFGVSGNLGCAFSPREAFVPEVNWKRTGQQKQRISDRSYGSKNDRKTKFLQRSE